MWVYDEHEYHMLPVAIKERHRAPLVHSPCEVFGGNNCDSLIYNLRWSEMFGKGVLLVLLVLGVFAYQAQAACK